MALIKCKECKAEISNKAKACPQCGSPVMRKTSPIAWIALVIMIAIITIAIISVDTNKPSADAGNTTIFTPSINKANTLPKQPNSEALTPVSEKETSPPKQINNELQLTLSDFNKGMIKYLKTIPQCKTAKLTTPRLFMSGKNSYQEIILNTSKIDVIADIADSKKLTNIKFTSMGQIKNDDDLRAMMCATYSIVRTLQPKYQTQEGALGQAKHIWVSSKEGAFEMSYFFDKIKAEHIPFELNVYHQEQ